MKSKGAVVALPILIALNVQPQIIDYFDFTAAFSMLLIYVHNKSF